MSRLILIIIAYIDMCIHALIIIGLIGVMLDRLAITSADENQHSLFVAGWVTQMFGIIFRQKPSEQLKPLAIKSFVLVILAMDLLILIVLVENYFIIHYKIM